MDSIKALVASISKLGNEAVEIYKPIVNDIIVSENSNVNDIKLTLDYMLDLCFNKEMTQLYQKLCDYLKTIDENSALFYEKEYYEVYVKEE